MTTHRIDLLSIPIAYDSLTSAGCRKGPITPTILPLPQHSYFLSSFLGSTDTLRIELYFQVPTDPSLPVHSMAFSVLLPEESFNLSEVGHFLTSVFIETLFGGVSGHVFMKHQDQQSASVDTAQKYLKAGI